MVKSKYKSEDLSKFLNSWDRKTSKLIRAMSIKHAKTIFKKKGIKYRKNGTITILHPKILKVKPIEIMGVSFDTFETYKM